MPSDALRLPVKVSDMTETKLDQKFRLYGVEGECDNCGARDVNVAGFDIIDDENPERIHELDLCKGGSFL